MVSKTLKNFENQLTGRNFYRLHKSYLINLDYVKVYRKHEGGKVEMADGTIIPVPRRKKEDFKRIMSGINE